MAIRRRSGSVMVKAKSASPAHRRCHFEQLESRQLLSASTLADLANVFATPAVSSGGYTPTQVTSAYLAANLSIITNLKTTITGDGTGQTIAIVDAYNDPNIQSDLQTFSTKFGLYYSSTTLKVVSQTGSTTALPTTNADWGLEIALDVEWAHAIAPKATILLVEANSASFSDLLTAVKYAASYTGVSVVSMSWGTDEFKGETSYDSYFTTSSNHNGVTFIASSGDSGTTCWPSVSSNVLSVGGTTLTVSSSGTYVSETAWSSSGGGVSKYESLPSYQKMLGVSATGRVTPDVSYDANSSTGFLVYDSLAVSGSSGWLVVGGTSAGAPQWAAIIAIANQGRVAGGLTTLTSANAVIYTLYMTDTTSDFHDVTSGRNTSGYSAAKGYDAVTGLGSPIVSWLVNDLATATATSTKASTTKIVISGSSQGTVGGWGPWGNGPGRGPGGGPGGGSRFDVSAEFGGIGGDNLVSASLATTSARLTTTDVALSTTDSTPPATGDGVNAIDSSIRSEESDSLSLLARQTAKRRHFLWNFDQESAKDTCEAIDSWFAELADHGFALDV
jgi:subtilase family serine protease